MSANIKFIRDTDQDKNLHTKKLYSRHSNITMVARWTLRPHPNSKTDSIVDDEVTLKTTLVIMGVVALVCITIGCCSILMKWGLCCCKKKRSPLRRTPAQMPNERQTQGDRFSVVNREMADLLGSNIQTGRDGSISIDMDQRDRVLSRLEGRGYSNTVRVLREIFGIQLFDIQDISSESTSDANSTQNDLQIDQLPPTYEELLDQNERQTHTIESNTERVLREIYSRPTWLDTFESNHDLNGTDESQYIGAFEPGVSESREDITNLGNNVQHTTAIPEMGQTETDPGTEQTRQTWTSYFNIANRLRDLINGILFPRNTINEVDNANHRNLSGESTVVNVDISEQYYSRPRTPPPAYHDLENCEPMLARTNSLPSYDDFIMMPYKYAS